MCSSRPLLSPPRSLLWTIFVQQVDGIALSCAQFAVVIMLSAIGALAFGEHTTLEAVKTCIPYLLYVGVVSSGVGYTLQIIAQKDGDPTVVSLLLSLESFFLPLSAARSSCTNA